MTPREVYQTPLFGLIAIVIGILLIIYQLRKGIKNSSELLKFFWILILVALIIYFFDDDLIVIFKWLGF